MADQLTEDFKDACRKGGGRLETMQQGKRNTHQCITDHGKLDLDLYNKERIPNEVTGQSISSENNPVKMKGRVKDPDKAYYDRNNNRIVVKTKDGNKLSIHNDKQHKDDDNKGEYY